MSIFILITIKNTFFHKCCTFNKNTVINKDMSKPLVIVESPTKVKTIFKNFGI